MTKKLFTIAATQEEGGDEVKFVADFAQGVETVEAFKLMGMTVSGIMQSAAKLGEAKGLSEDQVLALLGLPVH